MRVYGIIVTTFLLAVVKANRTLRAQDVNVSTLTDEINSWLETGQQTELFRDMLTTLSIEMQRDDRVNFTGERANSVCTICQSLVKVVMTSRREGKSEESIETMITNLCVLMHMYAESVCKGVIKLNWPTILYIIDNKPNLTEFSVCSLVFQQNSCLPIDEEFEWEVEIPVKKEPTTFNETNEGTFKILHISDIHYDPAYEPYGNSKCDEPTCCREGQNLTSTDFRLAGYWGDYNNCDTPWHAVADALDHMKGNLDGISYVYFTGDILDHGVWETTEDLTVDSMTKVFLKMKEAFGNISVYPILGNHEPSPVNLFAPVDVTDKKVSTLWMYELAADIFIDLGWLPVSTRDTILQGGYYTVSPKPGFRIIALNNNVCQIYNWWYLYEPRDQDGQLNFLIETLSRAERDGEHVHILAHIPAGSEDCQYTWGREYQKIIKRFAGIITAQFNGHTHNDELRIFYDTEEKIEAFSVAWIAGSITAFTSVNPSYKIYTLDAKTRTVVNFETWMYNLTLANETPDERPVWYKSYSFKEAYGLEELTLSSLNKWVTTLATNDTQLYNYFEKFWVYADSALRDGCNESCLKDYLCKIVTTAADDHTACDHFKNLA